MVSQIDWISVWCVWKIVASNQLLVGWFAPVSTSSTRVTASAFGNTIELKTTVSETKSMNDLLAVKTVHQILFTILFFPFKKRHQQRHSPASVPPSFPGGLLRLSRRSWGNSFFSTCKVVSFQKNRNNKNMKKWRKNTNISQSLKSISKHVLTKTHKTVTPSGIYLVHPQIARNVSNYGDHRDVTMSEPSTPACSCDSPLPRSQPNKTMSRPYYMLI